MKKPMTRRYLFILLIFLLSLPAWPSSARAGGQKHFLWQVKTATATVYLLGSVHFMKKDAYPLSRVIEDAFDRSDTLAVEADINSIGKGVLERLRLKGFYQGEDSIANHVSQETYAYITGEAARLGLPIASFIRQKPWLLGMTMTAIELMKAGYNPHYGIDKYFLTKASGKKNVVELESVDYQIDLLAGLPDQEQEHFLIYALKDLASLVRQVDALMTAWATGDAGRIASIMEESVASDSRLKVVHEKILTDRNRNMAKKIASHLRSRGTVFVVVGAGHLVGDLGIVGLLRKEGYHVEQL